MENYKIYPKQFKNDKIPIEKNRCFVLMPFNPEYNYIYGSLKNELTKNGYICNRADEIKGSQPIINKIIKEILSSQYIIADLTSYNPNVFYELGISHCFKDTQNILIIKQKDYKIPFDLTHLTYIEYDPNNLIYLTSMIKNFLLDNQYISDFNQALNLHGIINGVTDNREQFIEYVQDSLKKDLFILTDILNNNIAIYNEKKIDEFLNIYENLIRLALANRDLELIPGILKIYATVVCLTSVFYCTQRHLEHFLSIMFSGYEIAPEIVLQWQTEVIIFISTKNKLLQICLPWIINYFTQTKSTKIDLNRYKLESFLMLSNNDEVNNAIVAGLFSDNQYIRETMADIIGEKKLSFAYNMLITQLNVEENYFVMRSIIQAISKLQSPDAIVEIINWFNLRKKDIIDKRYNWIFRHIYTALLRLDKTPQKNIATKFKSDYQSFIEEYPV